MADAGGAPKTGEEPPWLERWGARVLLGPGRPGPLPRTSTDPVHVLDATEQATLRAVERKAVGRAALAGVFSALASAIAESVAGHHFGIDRTPTLRDLAAFWGVYGLVIAVASICEILYLYWDALVAVRELADGAGLDLREPHAEAGDVARSLARAALELPDPHSKVHGVDPRRESSRAVLVFASLAYKAKVGVTSFVFKALVRRALGRFATRELLSFAAVPVNAAWNAIVAFRVLREARIRAMGPSAIAALVPDLLPEPAELSAPARVALARAAGAAIVRTQAAHPNLVALLRAVLGRVGPLTGAVVLDDTRLFLAHLVELPRDEQALVLRVLAAASIVDGKLAPAELRLLRDALGATGHEVDLVPVKRALRDFVHGRPIDLAPFAR